MFQVESRKQNKKGLNYTQMWIHYIKAYNTSTTVKKDL